MKINKIRSYVPVQSCLFDSFTLFFVHEMETVSKWDFVKNVASFAAVFRDVTQRALRDIMVRMSTSRPLTTYIHDCLKRRVLKVIPLKMTYYLDFCQTWHN